METTTEHSGVPVHPPLFFLSALLLGALIDDRVYPLLIFHTPTGRWIGAIVAGIGIVLVATGRATMIKHGTNVNPTQPTITIVQAGPFRFTRNPLYVGLTVIYAGFSLALNTWWSLLLLIPVWVVMHLLVVRREEAYLERKFGDAYLSYKRRVRRYL